MKTQSTELVFILDRSGSMSRLKDDTIGGFNSLLEKQKQEEGTAMVTTVLFNNEYKVIHDRLDISLMKPMTEQEYVTAGSTALLDAVGFTVEKIMDVKRSGEPLDAVLFVIITDGMENSSREYSLLTIRETVEHLQEKYGWEFLFLGANLDAVNAAASIGISRNRSVQYHADRPGTILNYEIIGRAAARVRNRQGITDDWASEVDEDYRRRKKH